MNDTQIALIDAETKPTELDQICNAITIILIGGIVRGQAKPGDPFWINLLNDTDQGKSIVYDCSFFAKLARFDPGIAIYHTNKEGYQKPTNGGYVATKGYVYIEVLIRNQNPTIADRYIGRLQNKIRSLLMTFPNFYNTTNTWFITDKEMLNIPEKSNLFTRVGRQRIECDYNPKVVYQPVS